MSTIWISGWHIDGFGLFRDEEVRELPPGLAVFEGPNEAGKSTLLDFLRAILFGIADAGESEASRAPLRGGRHGGRVYLETPEGTVTVERWLDRPRAAQVRLQDGTVLGEEELRRILGGADGRVFRSVFAIGLTELQTFAGLDAEGVRDQLFSAAVVGAGRSTRYLSELLERRQEALLGARGGGRAEELERRLARIGAAMAEAQRRAAEYPALEAEEARCRAELAELDAAVAAARDRERTMERLLALWPLQCELAEARRELDGLPELVGFPADAPARFAESVAAVRSAKDEVEARRVALAQARLQAEDARAGLDEAAASVAVEAEAVQDAAASHDEVVARRAAAAEEQAQGARLAEEALRRLGAGWTAERVLGFDRSAARRAEVQAWEGKLAAAREGAAALQAEERAARAAADEAQARLNAARRRAQEPPPVDAARVDRDEERVRWLREQIVELRTATETVETLRAHLETQEVALRRAEAAAPTVMPGWIAVLVGAGAAVAALLALVRLAAGDGFGAGLLAVLAVWAAVGAAFLWRTSARDEAKRQEWTSDLYWRRNTLGWERDRVAKEERATADARERLRQEASFAGFGEVPDQAMLDARERQLAAELETLDAWEREREDPGALEAEATRLAQEWTRLSFRRYDLDRACAEAEAAWAAWATRTGLPPELPPEGVAELFRSVRRARVAIRGRDKAAVALARLDAEAGTWEARARRVLAAAAARAGAAGVAAGDRSVDAIPAERLPERIAALVARHRADLAARERLARLEAEVDAAAEALVVAQARQAAVEAERAALVRASGSASEDEFRAKLRVVERRDEMAATVRRLETELGARLGLGADAEALRAELATGRRGEWEAARAAAVEELAQLEARRDPAIRAHEKAERERLELETSPELATFGMERQAVLTELAAMAREWAVAAAARGLAGEALHEYEQTRQPRVLALASRIFEGVTGGRYVAVQHEAEGTELVAVDRFDGRVRSSALSRGTAEQLYLSLRLALAAEFAARGVPLPIVLDDVLVNFDPVRARAMAAALARKAEDQQVLIFTCQPATVDLILDAAPDTAVRRLERTEGPANLASRRRRGAAGGADAPRAPRPRSQTGS
ncbi:MAG TPA: AAA family ATPase [Longimicrobiales bacterium]|nr:AAA family ATPase [Longimicrobiales bacterium]